MIILDANIIKSVSLRGPIADIFRAIRAAGVERVGAPYIALEEIAAQEALAYASKHKAASDAVDALRKATPWDSVPELKEWPDAHVRDHWRGRYASVMEVLGTSHAAYQQALFREANLIAPCKTVDNGKVKTGARDAAIWLTAVEYAQAHKEETVYFVSKDSDMSEGGKLKPAMLKDIDGMEDRFHVVTSLDDVVTKFAMEVDAGNEDVRPLLDTDESHGAILAATGSAIERYGFISGTPITSAALDDPKRAVRVTTGAWSPPAVALDKVLEVRGHQVGDHRYFTAWVRWLLRDNKHWDGEMQVWAYAWETRVLLSTAVDQAVTVIDFRKPGPITEQDIPNVPAYRETVRMFLARRGKEHFAQWTKTPDIQTRLVSLGELSPVEPSTRELLCQLAGVNELDELAAARIRALLDRVDSEE